MKRSFLFISRCYQEFLRFHSFRDHFHFSRHLNRSLCLCHFNSTIQRKKNEIVRMNVKMEIHLFVAKALNGLIEMVLVFLFRFFHLKIDKVMHIKLHENSIHLYFSHQELSCFK